VIDKFKGLAALASGLFLGLSLSGCAPIGGNSADPRTLSATTSAEELSNAFSSCEYDNVDGAAANEFISQIPAWVRVAEFVSADRTKIDEPSRQQAVIRTVDGRSISVAILSADWSAIDWALENQVTVWLGLDSQPVSGADTADGTNTVSVTMLTKSDGVFFAGECADRILRDPLYEMLGSNATSILEAIPTMTPEQRSTALLVSGNSKDTEAPEGSDVVILNPQTADEKLLLTLHPISIRIAVTEAGGHELSPLTICSRIPEGWNDCIPLTDSAVQRFEVSGYLDEDGVLEFWLADENANLKSPIALLGRIDISAVPGLKLSEINAVSVVIDTHGLSTDSRRIDPSRVSFESAS